MIPRTLSASSLQVAALCMDRWKSEYMHRAQGFSNSAAGIGTTFHGGAEMFIKACFIDKTHPDLTRPQQKELFITFLQMSYVQTFGSADLETEEYKDAFDLGMKWFGRTNLDTVNVESAEVKETIEVPFNHPDGTQHGVVEPCDKCNGRNTPGVCYVPFNYIIDRVDDLGDGKYEVVDYKTIRVPLQPEDLQNKVQARAYALAIQIKHPDAQQIKVTFDQIRHEKISLLFSRDDNIAFWRFLTAELQRIVDTPESDTRPTLNPECSYCVKKFTCKQMTGNIAQGGIHSLGDDEKVVMLEQIKDQIKANGYIVEALEEQVYMQAAARDELDWEVEAPDGQMVKVDIGSTRRRQFPAHEAAEIMGPELFAQMGTMTIGNLEKIIKDETLDKTMRDKLSSLMAWQQGGLQLKVVKKAKVI